MDHQNSDQSSAQYWLILPIRLYILSLNLFWSEIRICYTQEVNKQVCWRQDGVKMCWNGKTIGCKLLLMLQGGSWTWLGNLTISPSSDRQIWQKIYENISALKDLQFWFSSRIFKIWLYLTEKCNSIQWMRNLCNNLPTFGN